MKHRSYLLLTVLSVAGLLLSGAVAYQGGSERPEPRPERDVGALTFKPDAPQDDLAPKGPAALALRAKAPSAGATRSPRARRG
jgi:hypothetical protein